MELVIIIATITSFFSHLMIDKSIIANAVSVIVASLITWMLLANPVTEYDATFFRYVIITVVMALVVSMVVGLVFAYHKKCS